MIEEKLESLIERYTIEDETKNLKNYKDALEDVLKESDCLSEVDNSKILEQFPELLMPESCLEKFPGYGKTEDYIASIEVAYSATWTVEYEMIDSCK